MSKEEILKALSEIVDPELGQNIVEAGLVKDIKIEEKKITVVFAPTTIFCPLMEFFVHMIIEKIKEKFPEKEVEVRIYEEDI